MSMYNMLFGVNQFADILLAMLGITKNDVPRFRDCYLDEDGKIVIYTRTGGGNRDYYEDIESCKGNYPEYFNGKDDPSGPWNEDLRKVKGYIGDENDDFDCTYAYFKYEAPKGTQEVLEEIKSLGGVDNPNKKWTESLKKLNSKNPDQPTKELLEKIAPTMKKIFDTLEKGKSGVIEV